MNYRSQSGTFQFEEDVLSKGAQGIAKNMHEVIRLLKFLENNSQINGMNINYNDLYYTVNKNRDEREIANDEYENNKNEYIHFDDLITPHHYIGRKKDDIILK